MDNTGPPRNTVLAAKLETNVFSKDAGQQPSGLALTNFDHEAERVVLVTVMVSHEGSQDYQEIRLPCSELDSLEAEGGWWKFWSRIHPLHQVFCQQKSTRQHRVLLWS